MGRGPRGEQSISGGRWLPQSYDVVRGQYGGCLGWAVMHQRAHPHLSFGVHKHERHNDLCVSHFFTHDEKYAYDTDGVHELPYTFFPDDDASSFFEDNGYESVAEYGLASEAAIDLAASNDMFFEEDKAPSADWISRYAPDPRFPPDVTTPVEQKPEYEVGGETNFRDWNKDLS